MSDLVKKESAVQLSFEQLCSMAETVAQSRLFGRQWESKEKLVTLFLLAQAEGIHPLMAVQRYDNIQGTITKKSQTMLADFQAIGGRVEFIHTTDKTCHAKFWAPGSTEGFDYSYNIEMAKRAGLTDRENWRKYPEAMLRARCITGGLKIVYPAATSLMMSTEEAQDLYTPTKPAEKNITPMFQTVEAPKEAEILVEQVIEQPDEHMTLGDFLSTEELQDLATTYLKSIGWLQQEQELSELSEHHVQQILSKKEAFMKQLEKISRQEAK